MRNITKLCGGLVAGLLSVHCSNFCDEYPEACGTADAGGSPATGGSATGAGGAGGGPLGGAGTGGGGGETPVGPFDVTVSLVDAQGDITPDVAVLVSDSAGEIVELSDTGPSGSVVVSVPNHGRVSVFHDDSATKRAYSAEVVEGMSTLTFQLPPPLAGPATDANISVTCSGNCGLYRELSLSCHRALYVADTTPPYVTTVAANRGCPDADTYEAFAIAYDVTGRPVALSTQTGLTEDVQLHTLPAMAPVEATEAVTASLELTGVLDGFSVVREISVPYADRPGCGFSRYLDYTDPVIELQLIKTLVPNAWATFSVSTTPLQGIVRREWIDSVTADFALSFDIDSLAIPGPPEDVDLTTPGRPLASFELGQGPIGDAIQLVLYRDTSLLWSVSLPAASSGEVLFPALPPELAAFAMTTVDDFTIQHVDVDDDDGYVEWTSQAIAQPFSEPDRTETLTFSF